MKNISFNFMWIAVSFFAADFALGASVAGCSSIKTNSNTVCQFRGGFVNSSTRYFPGPMAPPPVSCGTRAWSEELYSYECEDGSEAYFRVTYTATCVEQAFAHPGYIGITDVYGGVCTWGDGWKRGTQQYEKSFPAGRVPPPIQTWTTTATYSYRSCKDGLGDGSGSPATCGGNGPCTGAASCPAGYQPLWGHSGGSDTCVGNNYKWVTGLKGQGGSCCYKNPGGCETYVPITGAKSCPQGLNAIHHNKNLCQLPNTWIEGGKGEILDGCRKDNRSGVCCGEYQ